MPLIETIILENTTILVWKITEEVSTLKIGITLNVTSENRLQNMKSDLHQRGFLSIRQLLLTAGYSDFDLFYDDSGKPYLKDGRHISITHSFGFSAIILSNEKVGIDIEKQKEKIKLIAHKFCDTEFSYSTERDKIQKLTVIWGAKEAVFKIINERGISFKNHIQMSKFEIIDSSTMATLNFNSRVEIFKIYFIEIEDYMLVYAFLT
jgi:phosphopantetheinyl transferase